MYHKLPGEEVPPILTLTSLNTFANTLISSKLSVEMGRKVREQNKEVLLTQWGGVQKPMPVLALAYLLSNCMIDGLLLLHVLT